MFLLMNADHNDSVFRGQRTVRHLSLILFSENINKGNDYGCLIVFFPDEYLDSTYVINFDDLYAQGIQRTSV